MLKRSPKVVRMVAVRHSKRFGSSYHLISSDGSRPVRDNFLSAREKNQYPSPNLISKDNQPSDLTTANVDYESLGKSKNQKRATRKLRHLWSPVSPTDLREGNVHDQWLVNRRKKAHRWKMKTGERKSAKKATQCHCSHQSGRHCCSKSKISPEPLLLKAKPASFKFQTEVTARNDFNVGDSRRYLEFNGGNLQGKSLSLPFAVNSYAQPSLLANSMPPNVRPYYSQLSNVNYLGNVQNRARTAYIPKNAYFFEATRPAPQAFPGVLMHALDRKNGKQPIEKTCPEHLQCCRIGDENEDVPSDSSRHYNRYNPIARMEQKLISGNIDTNDCEQFVASPDEGFGKLEGLSDLSATLDSFHDDEDDDDDDQELCSDNQDYHDTDVARDGKPSSLEGSDDDIYLNSNYEYNSLPQLNQNHEYCDSDVGDPKVANSKSNQWSPASESVDYASFPQKSAPALEKCWNMDDTQLSDTASQPHAGLDGGDPPDIPNLAAEDRQSEVTPATCNNAAIFPGVFAGPNSGQSLNGSKAEETDPLERNFKRRRRKNLSHLLSDFMVSKKTKNSQSQDETTPESVREFKSSPLVVLETTQNMLFSEMKEELKALQTTRMSKSHFKNRAKFRFLKEKSSPS